MAKLTPSQKARAKAMSKRRGVKYPNAWANLTVARGKKKSTKKLNISNYLILNNYLSQVE